VTEIAQDTGRSEPGIRTRIPSPSSRHVSKQILEGRQSADLSVEKLIRDNVPMRWKEQARVSSIA
jgi:hypothetical protein